MPTHHIIHTLLFLFTLLLSFGTISGQDSTANLGSEKIFDLTIEELTNVTVVTPSKSNETMNEAPSNVTVLTRAEIDRLGIDNMYDLFNYIPGFQTERGLWLGEVSLIHARGYVGENPYILIQIDGVTVNEISLGTTNAYTRYLDLYPVKQVEVIRGPGSALYGTSACLGVVNLITETDLKKGRLGFGSQSRTKLGFRYSEKTNNEIHISIGADYYTDNGASYTLLDSITTRDPRQYYRTDAVLKYKNLDLRVVYNGEETSDFLNFSRVANGINFNKTKTFLSKVSYKWKLDEKLSITPSASFSRWNLDLVGLIVPAGMAGSSHDFFAGPYSQSSRYDAELEIEYSPTEKDHIQLGTEANSYGLDISGAYSNHIAPDHSVIAPVEEYYTGQIQPYDDIESFMSAVRYLQSYGSYIQYRRKWNKNILTYLGSRYDIYTISKNAFSPRLAFIYHTPFNSSIKLLYGEAFRAPVHNELYGDSPVGVGVNTLKPEKIKTAEASYSQNIKIGTIDISYFNTSINDIIEFVPFEDTDKITLANNDTTFNSHGIELQSKLKVFPFLYTYITSTIILNTDSKKTFKEYGSLVISYQSKKLTTSASALYRQKRNLITQQNSYFLLNAHISYKFSNTINIYAKASNILNTKYFTNSLRRVAADNSMINRGLEVEAGLFIKVAQN